MLVDMMSATKVEMGLTKRLERLRGEDRPSREFGTLYVFSPVGGSCQLSTA